MIDVMGARTSFVRDGVHRLDELAQGLAAVRQRVTRLPSDAALSFGQSLCDLDREVKRAEACIARLYFSGPDAWQEGADAFDDLLRMAGHALAAVEADLATLETDEPQLFRRSSRQQLEMWQGLVEEMALQAHLAGLDLRDEFDRVRRGLRDVRHRHRQGFPPGGLPELRDEIRRSMDDVRHGVSDLRWHLASQ